MKIRTLPLVRLLVLFAVLSGVAWAQEDSATAADSGRVPVYLEGLDLQLPALETFRSWPDDALVERLYALPWSRVAFRRAELFYRPVFFVLTVDWNRACQRMSAEILTSPEVLRAINGGYITIIANADLRPDLRERYQTGGWPVVAFLLPNGKPVLSQANDMGKARPITTGAVSPDAMKFLLDEGVVYWNRWAGLLHQVGDEWAGREGAEPPPAGLTGSPASESMARWLMSNADRLEGGFGAAPKFLVPALEEYAGLRQARSLPALRNHSRVTLEKLVASPLFDRREGGLHRIAGGLSFTELQYEKMLEGNAFLVRQLVWSLRGQDSPELRRALDRTIGFLTDVLARPGGGFYLAQAADPTSPDGGGYWTAADRAGHPAPPVNELVLAGPNATTGAALLRAGLLLDRAELVGHGRRALELVYRDGYRVGRGVFHALEPVRDPRVYLVAQGDSALAFADAYETTGDTRYLDAAQDIVDFVEANLRGPEEAALRDHLADPDPIGLLANERRPLRPNVRIARAMVRLAEHGRGEHYREAALRILGYFSGDLGSFGVHGTEAALAIEEATVEPLRIVLSGKPDNPAAAGLRRAAINGPWPWTVVSTSAAEGDEVSAEVFHGERRKTARDPAELARAMRALITGEGS